ncbi:hypothetical protein LS64_008570, partial [Helicobacter saguini]
GGLQGGIRGSDLAIQAPLVPPCERVDCKDSIMPKNIIESSDSVNSRSETKIVDSKIKSKKLFDFNHFSDNIALIDDSENVLTYKDLNDFTSELDSKIKRDLCVIFCCNTIGCAAFYAALLESKIVLLNIASDLDSNSILRILNDYKPRYLCMPSNLAHAFFSQNFKNIFEKYNYMLLESCLDSMDDTFVTSKENCVNNDIFNDNIESKNLQNLDSKFMDDTFVISKKDSIISNNFNQTPTNQPILKDSKTQTSHLHPLYKSIPKGRPICKIDTKSASAKFQTPTHRPCNDISKNLALLLSTSGSTGSVKFVRLSYQNLKSNTDSIIKYLNLDSKERALLILPLNYTFGLSILHTHLRVGASVAITQLSVMQKGFWEFLESSKATSLSGVPYTFEMLKKLNFFTKNLPHLKTLTQAGGKLRSDLQKEFATFALKENKKFIIMYGQTEASARMSYLPFEYALKKLGSIGIPVPNGKFEILDSKGCKIKESQKQGELIYKGKNVALGYAENRESLSKGDDFKGILHTGDIAYFDKDKFYYIVGRKSRFIKMQGKRISLDEIDSLLHATFKDVTLVTSGLDDMLYIFIESKNCNLNEIKKFICNALKIAPFCVKIKEIDKIPRTKSGKILYSQMEKYYE